MSWQTDPRRLCLASFFVYLDGVEALVEDIALVLGKGT